MPEEKKNKLFGNAMIELSMRMSMDMKNKVESLEEIGMTDPFRTRKSLKDTISIVRTFDFYTEVYPNQVMSDIIAAIKVSSSIQPPKTMFVPGKKLTRKMIRAICKYGKTEDTEKFFLRFGLI
jgi:hypothetical protein